MGVLIRMLSQETFSASPYIWDNVDISIMGRDILGLQRESDRQARSQVDNYIEPKFNDIIIKKDIPTARLLEVSETQLKILEAMVGKTFNDEMTKYKIANETGIDYPRVHECIEGRKPREKRRGFPGLKNFELLRGKKIGTAPAGQPKKAYALTFGGLVKVLAKRPKLWGKIDEIALGHVEIFPLFAKWDYFTQTGVKDFVVRSLKEFFEGWPHPFLEAEFTPHGWEKRESTIRFGGVKIYSDEWEDFRSEATRRALSLYKPGVHIVPTVTEVKAWVEAISSDPELSKFILELGESTKRWISATKDAKLSFEDDVLTAVKQKNPELLIRRRMKKRKLQKRENYLDKRDVLTKELEQSCIKHWRSRIKKRE